MVGWLVGVARSNCQDSTFDFSSLRVGVECHNHRSEVSLSVTFEAAHSTKSAIVIDLAFFVLQGTFSSNSRSNTFTSKKSSVGLQNAFQVDRTVQRVKRREASNSQTASASKSGLKQQTHFQHKGLVCPPRRRRGPSITFDRRPSHQQLALKSSIPRTARAESTHCSAY